MAYENAWNSEDCSPNIFLLENQLTMHRNAIPQLTDAIRGKRRYLHGKHYWTITWHGPAFGSNALIGMATKDQWLQSPGYCPLLGSSSESWGWDIPHRVLRYQGKIFSDYPLSDVKVSSQMSLLLHCKPGSPYLYAWVVP